MVESKEDSMSKKNKGISIGDALLDKMTKLANDSNIDMVDAMSDITEEEANLIKEAMEKRMPPCWVCGIPAAYHVSHYIHKSADMNFCLDHLVQWCLEIKMTVMGATMRFKQNREEQADGKMEIKE